MSGTTSGMDKSDSSTRFQDTNPETYFANEDTRQCALSVWARIEEYYTEMKRTGRLGLYRNSFTSFYAGWLNKASMWRSGEVGELTRSFVNHARNIMLHLKVQTTQNKLTYKPQVNKSDSQASYKRELCESLLHHCSNDETYGLNTVIDQTVEDGLVFGESSIAVIWNKHKGKPYAQDPNTQEVFYEGDIEYWNLTPMDLIYNTTHQSRDEVQWKVARRWVNKFDLAAIYPALKDNITSLYNTESTYGVKIVSLLKHDSYTIPIFYFFHEPTPAVPQGRYMVMVDPETVLEDGPLTEMAYEIPIYDFIVNTMNGSPFGYTVAFDLLPLQQAFNELYSSVLTNNINFATQIVIGPKGGNIHYQNLAAGMSYLEYDPKAGPNAKPEALNLTHSAPETYQLMDKIVNQMETIAGINSLMRGNPSSDITSGQYGALVTVQSVIFNNGLQKAYARLARQVGTCTIETIYKNMKGEKVIEIVGQNMAMQSQKFTAQGLQGISGVDVDITNPMLQTPAGKMQMADNLMKTGLIKDPQQYIGVYTDGDLPQLYHRQETQLQLVKEENEYLLKGMAIPPSAPTDNHVMHILEHTSVIDSIETRVKNPKVFTVAMQHIQSHIDQLTGNQMHGPLNPVLAGIIGDPTLPPGTPNGVNLPPVGMGVPHNMTGGTTPNQGPTGAQVKGNPQSVPAPASTLPQTGTTGPQPMGPQGV